MKKFAIHIIPLCNCLSLMYLYLLASNRKPEVVTYPEPWSRWRWVRWIRRPACRRRGGCWPAASGVRMTRSGIDQLNPLGWEHTTWFSRVRRHLLSQEHRFFNPSVFSLFCCIAKHIFLRKITNVAPLWRTWLRTRYWKHPAGFKPTTPPSQGVRSPAVRQPLPHKGLYRALKLPNSNGIESLV